VLVLDVDEAESHKILLTLDPLAGLATASLDQLQSLLAEVQTENESVRRLLDSLTAQHEADQMMPGEEQEIPREVNIPESYQVVIECRDEEDQRVIFERMCAEGYRCRVLTL
jgi:hypothetical protein